MSAASIEGNWPSLGDVVDAFEEALSREGGAEVNRFAPSVGHPERLEILCELVRVDLEHRWSRGDARRLEDYQLLFPDVFRHPELVREMAYEEYRLRQQAGGDPTIDEYQARFGLSGLDWPSRTTASPSGGRHAGSANGAADRRAVSRLLESEVLEGDQAEFLKTLDRTDPHAAERLAGAMFGLPPVGASFLGFRLCAELGRGAFGRVFLARQGDLAGRPVALKVTADVAGETHALARLQHTNIVPIFSVHRRGPLRAVCMPYLGSTTLADTLAELRRGEKIPDSGEALLSTLRRNRSQVPDGGSSEDMTGSEIETGMPAEIAAGSPSPAAPAERIRAFGYVPAVLWLMARVAGGLAHAHERGILHRDLKPANILFADDGEPILLDFNLAADVATELKASVALIGGTLAYMAPEHLEAFRDGTQAVDARSDVYAIGVILHELLTGSLPFPTRRGPMEQILPQMIADRRAGRLDVRSANPAVSQAVASLVGHCLEPDPARRYQSAHELREDLERQLADLPLRHAADPSPRERLGKWARRHPRLTSSTTVGLVAAILLTGVGSALVVRNAQYRRSEAIEAMRWLANERKEALALLTLPQSDAALAREGLARCDATFRRFGVLDDKGWARGSLLTSLPEPDRAKVRRQLDELVVMASQTRLREARRGRGPKVEEPASERPARQLAANADATRLLFEDPERLDAEQVQRLVRELDRLGEQDPQNWGTWIAIGNWNLRLHRPAQARAAYDVAVALAPRTWPVHFVRGLMSLDFRDFTRAVDDFDRVLALKPGLAAAYLNRALAKLELDDARGAVDDLTTCLKFEDAPSRAWLIRARARQKLDDQAGAAADRAAGLKQQPRDPDSFVARGLARIAEDPKAALADFDAALAIDPRHPEALQDKASVMGETLGRPEDALAVLDRLIQEHPERVQALCGRGVQLARFGRADEAIRDARAALALDQGGLTLYQVACIYSLLSAKAPSHRSDALRFVAEAIRKEDSWLAVARTDPDLEPLRGMPEFSELLRAAEVVTRGSKGR